MSQLCSLSCSLASGSGLEAFLGYCRQEDPPTPLRGWPRSEMKGAGECEDRLGTREGGSLLPLRLRGAGHALWVLLVYGLQDDAEAARAAPSKKTVWIPSTADTSLFCQGVRVRVLPPSVVSWEAAGSQRCSWFKASARKEGPLALCPAAGLRDSRAQLANAKMALPTWPQLPVHARTIHLLNRPQLPVHVLTIHVRVRLSAAHPVTVHVLT